MPMNKARGMYVLVAFLTALAASVFIVTLVEATDPGLVSIMDSASDTLATSNMPLATTTDAVPTRLLIPSIGVDANVQMVGITATGNMATPKGFVDVGWYRYGVIPGNKGSAVIAGHVDNGLSLAGVFKHLVDVKVGDDVYVVNALGEKLHFKVDAINSYQYEDVPLDTLFGQNDRAHVNLITCDGAWIGEKKTYDRRLVVYTSLRED